MTSGVASFRKMSDELMRRRISDLSLSDEPALALSEGNRYGGDRKSSSGSVLSDSSRKSSSDDLRRKKSSDLSLDSVDQWKFDHEPRRMSDVSVVLTHDTDSFIIGDRVWVGGTKSGQIAYIGETQFAPGEWAGVVLDEAIGKNDGSVANIRYFQCEPKRGIFSRLTRLTRVPLSAECATPRTLALDSPTKNNDSVVAKTVPKSKMSPAPTPTTPTSRSSFSKSSSPDSSIHPNVTVGDRVIVMSSQGSKAGVLRFLGATDFAPGEWCGVELDDPLGKNDGSVAGTRYFECRPKFGLFAPLHKVSKSPASKRPSQASCQIHRGGGSIPVRRHGSKESLASMSSVASTTASIRSSTHKMERRGRTPTAQMPTKTASLQEMLKEKDVHIEHLLKERDLERAEVTRAASQADEAEKRLAALRREFQQSKEESEARIADLDAMVCSLKSENEEISGQLDEERKKYEDLQFRFEEISIETGDVQLAMKMLKDNTVVLEKRLADEKKRTEIFELESNKLFEAEEQLVGVKIENETMREAIAQNEKIFKEMEEDRISLEAAVRSLRAQVESLKTENEAIKSAASRDGNNLQETLSKTLESLELVKLQMLEKQQETNLLRNELENKDKNFAVAERETAEKLSILAKEMQEKDQMQLIQLARLFEDMKMSSNIKLKVLEDKLTEKMNAFNGLLGRIQDCNLKLSKSAANYKSVVEEKRMETEEKIKAGLKENEKIIEKLRSDLKEAAEKSRQLEESTVQMKKQLEDAQFKLIESHKQIEALNQVICVQKGELDRASSEVLNSSAELLKMKSCFDSAMNETSKKMEILNNEMKMKNVEIEESAQALERAKKSEDSKINEISEEFEKRKNKLEEELIKANSSLVEKERESASLREQLQLTVNRLEKREHQLEDEKKSGNTLMEKLTAAQNLHQQLAIEYENLMLKADASDKKLESLQRELTKTFDIKETLETDLAMFKNSSNDSLAQLSKMNEELRHREKDLQLLRIELSTKNEHLQRAEQEHRKTVSSKQKELDEMRTKFEERQRKNLEQIEKLQCNYENLSVESHHKQSQLQELLKASSDELQLRTKAWQDETESLQKAHKQKEEMHEETVKQMELVIHGLEEKLASLGKSLDNAENDTKKKAEEFEAERHQLKQELHIAKSESIKIRQELTEKASEKSLQHSAEMELVRGQVKKTVEQLNDALKQVAAVNAEKNHWHQEKENLMNYIAALEEKEAVSTEIQTNLTSIKEENETLKNRLAQMTEDKSAADKARNETAIIIADFKFQLKSFYDSINNIEQGSSDGNETLGQQCETTPEETDTVDDDRNYLNNEITQLKQKLEEILTAYTSKSEASKQQLKIRGEELSTMEKRILEAGENAAKVKNLLSEERLKCEEIGKKLAQQEKEKSELMDKIQEQGVIIEQEQTQVKHLMEELANARNSLLENKLNFNNLQPDNSALLLEKQNEISNLSRRLETLQTENNMLSNCKSIIDALEKEKMQLQHKINQMQAFNNNDNEKSTERANEQDSPDFTQGQVDFLNSVIVDMQKKNDALKARIEILEMGFSPDDFTLEEVRRGAHAAPRLFCDICDRFDLHDTEDCPTQAMDVEEPMVPRGDKPKKSAPPAERPYCDICEVFGHDTANCDDAETF